MVKPLFPSGHKKTPKVEKPTEGVFGKGQASTLGSILREFRYKEALANLDPKLVPQVVPDLELLDKGDQSVAQYSQPIISSWQRYSTNINELSAELAKMPIQEIFKRVVVMHTIKTKYKFLYRLGFIKRRVDDKVKNLKSELAPCDKEIEKIEHKIATFKQAIDRLSVEAPIACLVLSIYQEKNDLSSIEQNQIRLMMHCRNSVELLDSQLNGVLTTLSTLKDASFNMKAYFA
jgi:hypothetical protein